ncbi:MAG: class I SAM-dependent methyltransferase [Tannerellaceae bacterium]|jgi:hypothetical protein|nr:class I SAM-dependent methyltransferase [Tannerellaceae bacterium]
MWNTADKNRFLPPAAAWAARLKAIDYGSLPISDYSKRYIRAMHPAMEYYMEIFARCLSQGTEAVALEPAGVTLVDYGGGSGFLSLLAKETGFGHVIYIDLNPAAVETVNVLKRLTGTGPDTILHGDHHTLAGYCRTQNISPQLLIATDLIEHVYNPAAFFHTLCRINNRMQLIFTTASTPFNPLVKQRLRRYMTACESGTEVSPNYLRRREQFIRRCYPLFSEEQTALWSRATRGLTYEDIRRAIDAGRLPVPEDPYNTCDPATGNWAERILPIRTYRALLTPCGYTLTVGKGFYNTRRKNPLTSLAVRILNLFIRYSGPAGLYLSPFILLRGKPDPKRSSVLQIN